MSLKTWSLLYRSLVFPQGYGTGGKRMDAAGSQQEEADAAEPESWTHRHELNPVNPVDCKAGGSLWEKIALQFFFRLNPCRNYRR